MHDTHARRHFAAGDILIRQGERGECAFYLEQGRVEILTLRPGGDIVSIATRGPGSLIGEMAIIDCGPRLATVRAIEDCTALEITRDEFAHRLAHGDPVVRLFTEVIVARFRDVMSRAEIGRAADGRLSAEELEIRLSRGSAAVESLRMANQLRAAIGNGELSLRYQPMVEVVSGRVSGFEALMRWQHPERGAVSPDVFIPVAEETGLIIDVTTWALGEACRALKRLDAAGADGRNFYMSVNFSSDDLTSDDFVERVHATIGAAEVSPKRVHLEITERVLMNRFASAHDNLSRCRADGIGIAIDDFGTGYSSLSYLYAFPIDTLKIDRSFIVGMTRDEDAFGVVRSIIGLAKTLRMTVVAEGVETAEDVLTLRSLGCDCAQGYYFAKPLTEAEASGFLLAWKAADAAM
jgi:EAL domain-containing protein (putative c-di-GMP-specific phosphodiesterase class I)